MKIRGLAQDRRDNLLFAAGALVGLGGLACSLHWTMAQAVWLYEHGVPPWLLQIVIPAEWIVCIGAMGAMPAWPSISWRLYKKRRVTAFQREADSRVAQLRIAGVMEVAALATVLKDATYRFEVARQAPFSDAWSPEARAYGDLCERYCDGIEAHADHDADPAARVAALRAIRRFYGVQLAAMKSDLIE